MKRVALAVVCLPFFLNGCASTPDNGANTEVKQEKDYVTGSNLPRRDRRNSDVIVVSPESVQDGLRRSAPGRAAGSP